MAGRSTFWPYRLLTTILYGEFDWLTRHQGGMVTLPMKTVSKMHRLRYAQIRSNLAILERNGLITDYRQYDDYALVRPAVPAGMARDLGGVVPAMGIGAAND